MSHAGEPIEEPLDAEVKYLDHGGSCSSMSDDGDDNQIFATTPLKRHPALQPLSREHVGGLIQAHNLQHAANEDRAVGKSAAVWRSEIWEHFDDEERLLLPLTSSRELRERLLAEHGALRELAERCESDPSSLAANAEAMHTLCTLLHDHIRWDERVYFESVQREHPEALAQMMNDSAAIEGRQPSSRARYPATRQNDQVPHEGPSL